MFSRLTPVLRSSLPIRSLALRPSPRALLPPLQRRFEANKVAGQPGSQDLKHAALNIKEEVGTAAAEVVKAIGGVGSSVPGQQTDLKSITTDMVKAIPNPVLIWGVLGTVPYGITAVATAWTARNISHLISTGATDPSLHLMHSLQSFQITYGSVILSSLGLIHWGFEMSKMGGEHGHKRLILGVLPLAYAWPTLYMADPMMALVAQWAGFLASYLTDRWASTQGWTPVWYASYRFYLTAIVGGSILFSLGSLSYYDVRDQSLIHTHAEVTQGLNTGATRMSQKKIDDLPVSFKPKAGGSFGVLTAKKSAEEEEEQEAEKDAVAKKQEEKDDHQKESTPDHFKSKTLGENASAGGPKQTEDGKDAKSSKAEQHSD